MKNDKHIVVKETTLLRLKAIAKYTDTMDDVVTKLLDHWESIQGRSSSPVPSQTHDTHPKMQNEDANFARFAE